MPGAGRSPPIRQAQGSSGRGDRIGGLLDGPGPPWLAAVRRVRVIRACPGTHDLIRAHEPGKQCMVLTR